MESVKGFFRRGTMTAKTKMGGADSSSDQQLEAVSKNIRLREKTATNTSDKLVRLFKNLRDVGVIMKDLAEDYKAVTEQGDQMSQLCDSFLAASHEMTERAAQLEQSLRTSSFDPLGQFIREIPKLKEAEEAQKKSQLEFDFFRHKVADLKKNPPKDGSRIPRNEHILEQWRRDYTACTEHTKAVATNLYHQGQRTGDNAIVCIAQNLTSFYIDVANCLQRTISAAQLPQYSDEPLFAPAPELPPMPAAPAYYTQPIPGQDQSPGQQPPGQSQYASPQNSQQYHPQQYSPQQQGYQQQPPPQQYQQYSGHEQPPQQQHQQQHYQQHPSGYPPMQSPQHYAPQQQNTPPQQPQQAYQQHQQPQQTPQHQQQQYAPPPQQHAVQSPSRQGSGGGDAPPLAGQFQGQAPPPMVSETSAPPLSAQFHGQSPPPMAPQDGHPQQYAYQPPK